jgi:hypothetical protein
LFVTQQSPFVRLPTVDQAHHDRIPNKGGSLCGNTNIGAMTGGWRAITMAFEA